MKTVRTVTLIALLIMVASLGFLTESGKAQEPKAPPTDFSKELAGVWVLVGTPGQVFESSVNGGRLHFFAGNKWNITQSDLKTGAVIFHHGGTFTVNGNVLFKKVEYANQNTAGLIGQSHKFSMKIEGDTLTQTGLNNPWTEVWKRIK